MVSIIFSSSDLSVPITELVRMVKLYSTPWETKSAALKKLHEDYEKWVIWFLFLPSFLLPNVRVKAAFISFVWLGAAFIGNFASIVHENYINMTLILLFFFSYFYFNSKQRQLNVALQKLVLVGIQVYERCFSYVCISNERQCGLTLRTYTLCFIRIYFIRISRLKFAKF